MPASLDPLALRGTGFVRRERVRLSVSAGPGTVERRVRAGRRGSFRVSFPGVDTCNGVTADASGNRGSRASFQLSSLDC